MGSLDDRIKKAQPEKLKQETEKAKQETEKINFEQVETLKGTTRLVDKTKSIGDIVTLITTILATAVSIWVAYSQEDLKQKQADLAKRQGEFEIELRKREFENDFKFRLFEEVKRAIEKPNEKLIDAVIILIEELLPNDIEFPNKLLGIIKFSNNVSESTKRGVQFILQNNDRPLNKVFVDIFYLEEGEEAAKTKAQTIALELRSQFDSSLYAVKKVPRLLSKSKNNEEKYGIDSNQIRYETTNQKEVDLAKDVLEKLNQDVIGLTKKAVLYPNNRMNTYNYISVFIKNP
jgi:hypothetical protein